MLTKLYTRRMANLYNQAGLDIEAVRKTCEEKRISVNQALDYGDPIKQDELLALDVAILIPAAIGDAIHEDNAPKVKARLIVETANMPLTYEDERMLTNNGITVIPDVMANAGGMTVSYLEWIQNRSGLIWNLEEVEKKTDHILYQAWRTLCRRRQNELGYRQAAYLIAVERVAQSSALRGYI